MFTEPQLKKWRVRKLSTALRQALVDLRSRERAKSKYVIMMSTWHVPQFVGKKCAVCLAGSRMCSLGGTTNDLLYPSDFDDQTEGMLNAMDSLRTGGVSSALCVIGRFLEADEYEYLDRIIVPYSMKTRRVWWRQIRQLQRDLVKAGL